MKAPLLLVASLISLCLLAGCGSREIKPGTFALNMAKSRLLMAFDAKLNLVLASDHTFEMTPLGASGTWTESNNTIQIELKKPPAVVLAMEGKEVSSTEDLKLNMSKVSEDEIQWTPTAFRKNDSVLLVFTRTK